MLPIYVGLCDRQTLIQTAIQQLLQSEPDLTVVWAVSKLSDALDFENLAVPDVPLIDSASPTVALISDVNRFKER
jgi:DNA-binding NarL/FixJ family response regulator